MLTQRIHNMVKKYPTHSRIFKYHFGYEKKIDEGTSHPADEWIDKNQYYQHLINKAFTSYDETPEFHQPDFQQVPMPHATRFRYFQQTLDARMGIEARNQLLALIRRQELLQKSLRRTKINIFDIIACNDFDMFITFSFGQDHYDIDKSRKKMMTWLDNQKKIHKKKGLKPFSYIIIPEYHKDRKAIHFHALFNNYQGNIVESRNPLTGRKVIQKGKVVYNIKSYTHGFTNMTYIKNKEATARYVSKYVTKDIVELSGQRRYWFSLDLKRPEKLYNENIDDIKMSIVYEGEMVSVYHSDNS